MTLVSCKDLFAEFDANPPASRDGPPDFRPTALGNARADALADDWFVSPSSAAAGAPPAPLCARQSVDAHLAISTSF